MARPADHPTTRGHGWNIDDQAAVAGAWLWAVGIVAALLGFALLEIDYRRRRRAGR